MLRAAKVNWREQKNQAASTNFPEFLGHLRLAAADGERVYAGRQWAGIVVQQVGRELLGVEHLFVHELAEHVEDAEGVLRRAGGLS